MTAETLAPPATCEAPIAQTAGTHGMRAVRCSQVVGVQRWFDVSGREHAACSLHRAARQALYAPGDPVWPGDLPADEEVIDHPADATVESEYATYWTAGTGTR